MKKRTFSKAFKVHAVKLVLEKGLKTGVVATQLELAPQTLYRWIEEYESFGDDAFVGKGNLHTYDKEMRQLKKRIEDLEMENMILKKAQAYFANQNKKN